MGVNASLGDGPYLKPGLSKRDTALLFEILKTRSKKTRAILADILEIDSGNLSRYAKGKRRLSEGSLKSILKKVEAAQKNKACVWLTVEEADNFRAAVGRGKAGKEYCETESSFRADLQSKIIKAFEKKNRYFRFDGPPPAMVVKAIEDSLDRIQEAMDMAVEIAEYALEEIDLDHRSWEERDADAEAGREKYEREYECAEAARRVYENMLPIKLRQGRSK